MKNILLLAIFLFGCSTTSNYYFPKGTFSDDEELDIFVRSWYSPHLKRMREPSLQETNHVVVYRFTWLRTFHSPMVFRLVAYRDGAYRLFSKRTNGAGGYNPGRLINNERITVTAKVANELITKLENECKFWSLPTNEEDMGLDGSQWIFEGSKSGTYHIVDRWSPGSGCLHEVGQKFMDLSKIKIEEIY